MVDDFLATGTTGVALHKIIQQAGAAAAGMAFLVEKRFQDGRGAGRSVLGGELLAYLNPFSSTSCDLRDDTPRCA